MFNLTSSTPKTWQTVSRQADRVNGEQTVQPYAANTAHSIRDLGGILRERREAMGASLAEVETATRIRQKYLAALESDDWPLLPGEIVGRGFLRNYATYLGLDGTELVERRRAVADVSMASTLAGTSAGSSLPPERSVDYRPKDVALKDEQEGIQQREIRTGPILRVLGIAGALVVAWWVISSFGQQIASNFTATVASVQTTVARPAEVPPVATATVSSAAVADNPNAPVATIDNSIATPVIPPGSANGITTQPVDPASSNNSTQANGSIGEAVPEAVPEVVEPNAAPTQAAPKTILIPTSTPAPVIVADAPISDVSASDAPLVDAPAGEEAAPAVPPVVEAPPAVPTATATPTTVPTEVPTATPTEEAPPAAPVVIAPACPDQRSVLTAPGVNQLLSGVVPINGSATHEAFQYYKLEYAFGGDATDGFVYFDGANSPIAGGTLGSFNSTSLPNGAYTLQLTVVDLSANYPPPCRVTVTIQN